MSAQGVRQIEQVAANPQPYWRHLRRFWRRLFWKRHRRAERRQAQDHTR